MKIKWVVRSASLNEAKVLLDEVLAMNEPKEVRERVNLYLESVGLGGLIRAGI